jgi:hypothetical protein
MIVKNIVNGVPDPLTEAEKVFLRHTETSRVNDGSTITYYQGDEPPRPVEPFVPEIKWRDMLNDLLTPGGAIITRMRATAKSSLNMSVEYSTVMIVIQNGANGFPDEATLQTLLRMNWGFTAGEKTTINNYLSKNSFSISVI